MNARWEDYFKQKRSTHNESVIELVLDSQSEEFKKAPSDKITHWTSLLIVKAYVFVTILNFATLSISATSIACVQSSMQWIMNEMKDNGRTSRKLPAFSLSWSLNIMHDMMTWFVRIPLIVYKANTKSMTIGNRILCDDFVTEGDVVFCVSDSYWGFMDRIPVATTLWNLRKKERNHVIRGWCTALTELVNWIQCS